MSLGTPHVGLKPGAAKKRKPPAVTKVPDGKTQQIGLDN